MSEIYDIKNKFDNKKKHNMMIDVEDNFLSINKNPYECISKNEKLFSLNENDEIVENNQNQYQNIYNEKKILKNENKIYLQSPSIKNVILKGNSIEKIKKEYPQINRYLHLPIMIKEIESEHLLDNKSLCEKWKNNKINFAKKSKSLPFEISNIYNSKLCIKYKNLNIILIFIYLGLIYLIYMYNLNIIFQIIITFLYVSIMIYIGNAISENLIRICSEMEKINNLDFEINSNIILPFRELHDIHVMQAKTLQKLNYLSYYVSNNVFSMISNGMKPSIGYETKNVTIFFSDIENFTKITEETPVNIITDLLTDYYNLIQKSLELHYGTLSDYIGDGVMAFFNAPYDINYTEKKRITDLYGYYDEKILRENFEDHPIKCVKMMLYIEENINVIKEKYKKHNIDLKVRMACNTGDVLVGNIGSYAFMKYGIVGDAVNLTSRLEGLNKHYGTTLIISNDTYKRVKDKYLCRILDIVEVKGRSSKLKIYELCGYITDINNTNFEKVKFFNKFHQEFIRKNFCIAEQLLDKYISIYGIDNTTQIYKERLDSLFSSDLPIDNIFTFFQKEK